MIDKVTTFKGGYSFGKLQGMPNAIIRSVGIPSKVVIPLKQGYGDEVKPIVKIGEKVKTGQIIAIDDKAISSPIHSSVSGTILDCENRIKHYGINNQKIHNQAFSNHNEDTLTVTIESDGLPDCLLIRDIAPDLDMTTQDGVFKALYMSGVSALGISGIPTPHNSSPIGHDKVRNIIIDGTNSEPFSLPVETFLKSKCKAFVDGLSILNFLYPDAEIDIAFDSVKKEPGYAVFNALNSDEDLLKNLAYPTGKLLDSILLHQLKPKYPQSDETILVETILGEVPVAKGEFAAIDYGVVILSIQDVISIYEAIIEGKPLIETVVSFGGTGLIVNSGLKVRIGTSVHSILSHRHRYGINSRIVLNSLMRGEVVSDIDIPVTKSITSIIAINENRDQEFQGFLRPGIDRGSFSNTFLSSIFRKNVRRVDTNLNGEVRECIVCNFCENVCPVAILPFLINKYVTHDMSEEAYDLKIFDCIECGLCSYVCPSKIPLLENIQKGKEQIRSEIAEQGEDEAA